MDTVDRPDPSLAKVAAEASLPFEPDESEEVDPEHQEGHVDHTPPEDD